jgi:hypothetical protein
VLAGSAASIFKGEDQEGKETRYTEQGELEPGDKDKVNGSGMA